MQEESLRITEVHYNPADPTAAEAALDHDDNNDFEFIEISNIGSETISLDGVTLDRVLIDNNEEGVEFDFSRGAITELQPGARLVVVDNAAAFEARYGNDIPVAGQWSGGLGNNSETVTLSVNGLAFNQFKYSDDWYDATDGNGSSLEIFDEDAELAAWNTAAEWRASVRDHGTPGTQKLVAGDVNGDGRFTSTDLTIVLQAGEYEDNVAANSTYEEGDWNGDGEFTSRDFVFAFTYGAYEFDEPVGAVGISADNLRKDELITDLEAAANLRIESAESHRHQRLEAIHAVDHIFDEFKGPERQEQRNFPAGVLWLG